MPSNHEWFPRYPKDEMAGVQRVLSGDALALLTQFRDFSWVNGGLPADEGFLKALAKTFSVSAHKFKNIWPTIEKFFIEKEGCFYYPEDEERRQKRVELIAKRKWAGRLGAEARWGKKVQSIETPRQMPIATAMASDRYPDPQEHTNRREPPSSPHSPAVDHEPKKQAEGGGSPPHVANATTYEQTALPLQSTAQTQEVCYQHDIQKIQQKAVSLGLAAPSFKLCKRLLEKFLPDPIEAVLGFLVRWEEQKTVGLWNAKSANDFRIEAARQQAGVPRKPSQRDLADMRLMERARDRDRAMGMA